MKPENINAAVTTASVHDGTVAYSNTATITSKMEAIIKIAPQIETMILNITIKFKC